MAETEEFKLREPITSKDGAVIGSVKLRALTVGDMIVSEKLTSKTAQSAAVIASVTGIDMPTIMEMHPRDLTEIDARLEEMLGDQGVRTGLRNGATYPLRRPVRVKDGGHVAEITLRRQKVGDYIEAEKFSTPMAYSAAMVAAVTGIEVSAAHRMHPFDVLHIMSHLDDLLGDEPAAGADLGNGDGEAGAT